MRQEDTRQTITLYRATDERLYVGVGSCWSRDEETARAYADNPGFGGAVLISATLDPEPVLDLTGRDALRTLAAEIAEETGRDRVDLIDEYIDYPGAMPQLMEEYDLLAILGESYSWVVYVDDYPDGAVTWRRLDEIATLAVERV